jgi:uncharacterized sulfatase
VELYHLGDDIGETMNLAKNQPAKAASLKRELGAWRQRVIATMPIPNPSFDPNRAQEWWSTRTGKPVPSKARKRYPPTEKGF